jgi:hypothetical protein
MPVSNAPLDKLIAHLKAQDTVAITDIDPHDLAAGLEDLKNRMAHAEHSHLKVLHDTRAQADRITPLEETTASLTRDRDEFRTKVDAAARAPEEHDKKIAELNDRVRAVEGAVGAAPYKPAKPIEPAKHEAPKYDAPPPKNEPAPTPINTPKAPSPLPQSQNPVQPT